MKLNREILDRVTKEINSDNQTAQILMDQNLLKKGLHQSPNERLIFLEKNLTQVLESNILYLERVFLYNFIGQYEEAYRLLKDRKLAQWKENKVEALAQYIYASVESAKNKIKDGDYEEAIYQLKSAQFYPNNFGGGKRLNTEESDIWYHLACAYNCLGKEATAKCYFELATDKIKVPSANNQQPDKIFYQGMAFKRLGKEEKALAIFENMIIYGEAHLKLKAEIDNFDFLAPRCVISENDLDFRNKINSLYMIGLGHLGLEKTALAEEKFSIILSLDRRHLGAQAQLRRL